MNFRRFLCEAQSVTQSLKSHNKVDVARVMKRAERDINNTFPFNMNDTKKTDLIKWHTLQLLNNQNDLVNCKDYIASELNTINFRDSSLNYKILKTKSDEWHAHLANSGKMGMPARVGEPVISFNDGWSWVALDRGYCAIEGKSMGHCGNSGAQPGDIIYSLRDKRNVPYLTFIVNNKNIGEAKGRENEKPSKEFHKYIIPLLTSGIVDSLDSSRSYLPENDFSLDDLTEEQREFVKKKNPKLFSYLHAFEKSLKKITQENLEGYLESLPLTNIVNIYIELIKDNNVANNRYYDDYKVVNNRPVFTANDIKPDNIEGKINRTRRYVSHKVKSFAPALLWANVLLKTPINHDLIQRTIDHLKHDYQKPKYWATNRNNHHLYFNQNSYDFMIFMIDLYKYNKSVFYEIYKSLESACKSNIVVNLIRSLGNIDKKLYYDLDDFYLKNLEDQLPQLSNDPDIEKIRDYKSMSDENDENKKRLSGYLNQESLGTSIADKILHNIKIPLEDAVAFGKNFLISLKEFKKALLYRPDIKHDLIAITKNKIDKEHNYYYIDGLCLAIINTFDKISLELQKRLIDVLDSLIHRYKSNSYVSVLKDYRSAIIEKTMDGSHSKL